MVYQTKATIVTMWMSLTSITLIKSKPTKQRNAKRIPSLKKTHSLTNRVHVQQHSLQQKAHHMDPTIPLKIVL
ncbi:unnamed protein product [Pseudo-nitzschia multistriata]|uniref:Uncharacterized protein n=1 Tax=Pseudo-nitzschia multistriata TaxID=183589 RepID=A0A448ZDN6_9STRA|nr:unnamed protein product [Pseudo-nitzschia multistriata]